MNAIKASIIIPVHNRLELLSRCLDSLNDQTSKNFEVIVSDDFSDAPIEKSISADNYNFPLKIITLSRKTNAAAARNAAIKNLSLTSALIIMLDSDCFVLDKQWVEKHIIYHTTGNANTLLHGKIIGVHKNYAGNCFNYMNWFMSCGNKPYQTENHHFPATNLSVTKKVFDIAGFFDETCDIGEDIDWSFRCIKNNIILHYIPDIQICHFDRDSFYELWNHQKKFGENAILIRKKNPSASFNFVFPFNYISAVIYYFPLNFLMTFYIVFQWLIAGEYKIIYYIPGIIYGHLGYCSGIINYFNKKRKEYL